VRLYEATYIISPHIGDDAVQSVIDKFSEVVTSGGGQVVNVDNWGKRRLAYEIKGKNEGIYVTMRFNAPYKLSMDLSRVLRISDDILRHIVVRIDGS